MTTATERIAESQQRLINHDASDTLRVIQAASVVAALPGIMSARARDDAASHLRAAANEYPLQAEILLAIVEHLEKV